MGAGLHSTSSTRAFLRTASSLTYHSNAFNCICLEFPWEMTKQVVGRNASLASFSQAIRGNPKIPSMII